MEYKHNPYIPTNMNYFTSQDALPVNFHNAELSPEPSPLSAADQFGTGEKVANLNPVANDLELGQRRRRRRKREAVQVVMAESVQDYNGVYNINDLYNKSPPETTTAQQQSSGPNASGEEKSPSTTSPPPAATEAATPPIQKQEIEWSAPLESVANAAAGQESSGQGESLDWTPQSNYPPVPPPQYPKRVANYDFQRIKMTIDSHKKKKMEQGQGEAGRRSFPHFHVTYWMFYPYSQGKTMCSISLGPLGRVPIPLIFGVCLGTRKDFGSHVGDWEHMSLFFRGGEEPDVSD